MRKWTRRAFIGAGTLVGGGLVLGVGGMRSRPAVTAVDDDGAGRRAADDLDRWSRPTIIVTVLVPHCEMGQGSQTALAMMAAEEMDADWTLVRDQGSAGARRVRQRLHGPRVHRRFGPAHARARASTTAPIDSRGWSACR